MCQEVGHTFGLDHQDENFDNANLGTCMDYTSDPSGELLDQMDNQHPNAHDFEMMASIYGHLNGISDGLGGGKGKGKPTGNQDIGGKTFNEAAEWGQAVKQDALGRNSLYVRNLGNGVSVITHVIWAK